MNAGLDKRLMLVWLALSAITLAQLGVGSTDGRPALAPNAAIAAGAIGIALIKVRIIVREFMEVRHAPVLLCRLTDLWVVFTGVALLCGYLAGLALADTTRCVSRDRDARVLQSAPMSPSTPRRLVASEESRR